MIAMPDKVKALLDASVRRVRRIYLLRGIAATLAVAIAATLAAMAVDAFFTLYSDAARWLLSAALYACVLAAAWLFLARPLSRRLDARRMAKILDARHPEHEECLTTLVELVDSAARGDGRPGFSEDLVGILSAKAAAAAAAVDAEREFTSRTIIRRLKALGAIALLLLLSFVLAPHLAGRLFVRAVAPWVDVGNLYSGDIAVKPGDVVALAGTVVRIEAAVADGLHYAPSIRISRRTALGWGEEFADEMKDGVYEATGKGIGGKVPLTVTIEGGKIVSVEVGENGETQGIGSKAIEQLPTLIVEANGIDGVDPCVSGGNTLNAIGRGCGLNLRDLHQRIKHVCAGIQI